MAKLGILSLKKSALTQFLRLSPARLLGAAVLVMATRSLLKRRETRFTPKQSSRPTLTSYAVQMGKVTWQSAHCFSLVALAVMNA